MKIEFVALATFNGQLVGVDGQGNLYQLNAATGEWEPFKPPRDSPRP